MPSIKPPSVADQVGYISLAEAKACLDAKIPYHQIKEIEKVLFDEVTPNGFRIHVFVGTGIIANVREVKAIWSQMYEAANPEVLVHKLWHELDQEDVAMSLAQDSLAQCKDKRTRLGKMKAGERNGTKG